MTRGSGTATTHPVPLEDIERATELAVLAGDDEMLGRAIALLGREIARRDPRVRAMLDLDEQLHALAIAQPEEVATS